jgi:hypothetical protein
MNEELIFIAGFVVGSAMIIFYLCHSKKILSSLEEKYERLVNILSEWQRKI